MLDKLLRMIASGERPNSESAWQPVVNCEGISLIDLPLVRTPDECGFALQVIHRKLGLPLDFGQHLTPERRRGIEDAYDKWLRDRKLIP